MENEMFTFVTLTHEGFTTEVRFCNRRDADKLFEEKCLATDKSPAGDTVAYYCPSVGGLVNRYTRA